MAILNYTTKIDAYKTLTEIQKILASHGAKKIVIDNNERGDPVNITFCVDWNGPVFFPLPCNIQGVLRAMKKSSKIPMSQCTDEQALRVAWRILKDWIEAQMAIIDAGMVDIAEVFLPYAITKHGGKTLYQHLQTDSGMLAIS